LLQEQLGGLVSLATQGSLGTGDDSAALSTTLRHDLRTPLNAVKGYGELIMEEARESGREDLLGDTARIMAAANQLLGQNRQSVWLDRYKRS
jgi:adenylate cyclase